VFEKVINHFLSSVWCNSSVELDFAFPVTEGAVAGIGGVGDVEVSMVFVGEQVRQICFERAVGAAETFVRVVPSFGIGLNGFLCKKCFPAFMPRFELFGEVLSTQFGEL
jgi:hypothetical protein